MKKVLFIAYHFPPIAGGGTFRSLKFVKYLPEFGWMPTVLTTNSKTSWAYDYELLKEIPSDVKILRAPEINLFYLQVFLSKIGLSKLYRKLKDHFFIPDEKIGWLPLAYNQAIKELKKEKYDLIFSTSPTPCAHLLALKLKRRFDLPWLCDFRDYWTTHFTYPYKNTIRYQIEKLMEKSFFKSAATITVVSNGMKSDFLHVIDKSFIKVIPNGFDEEIKDKSSHSQSVFNILYTGTFYGHYNPDIFLKTLLKIVRENPDIGKNIHLEFIGSYSKDLQRIFDSYKSEFNIDYTPFKSPTQLNEYFERAVVLLTILPGEAHYKSYLPAKMFTYLPKQKPILAIVPEGETKNILVQSGLGFCANPNSQKEIEFQILNLYNQWKTSQLTVNANIKYIQQFHRRNLTKQLAKVFNQIVKEKY